MEAFRASHPRGRNGTVVYQPEVLGIDPAERREALAFYRSRFGVDGRASGALMQALLWGVQSDRWDPPDPSNPLLEGLAHVPMRLVDQDVPRPVRPDWAVGRRPCSPASVARKPNRSSASSPTRTPTAALSGFFSFPMVMGHEVVAEVSELRPEDGRVGDRPAGHPQPLAVVCAEGHRPHRARPALPVDLSMCWHFTEGPLSAGIHTGTCKDAPGGFADFFPAHDSMLLPVPDEIPDEVAVLADPFSVSLHSVTRHPPPPGGRALVYGAGALGTTATAILRCPVPGRRCGGGRRASSSGGPRPEPRRGRSFASGAGRIGHRGGGRMVGRCPAADSDGAAHGPPRRDRRRLRHRRHAARPPRWPSGCSGPGAPWSRAA